MKKHFLKITRKSFIAICLLLIFASCTKVIQVSVPSGATLLVVDAFINNSADTQKVRLTTTADYFSNAPTPAVLGATVSLNDLTDAKTYTLTPDGKGNYYYLPSSSTDTMAQINHKYQLNVSYNGNSYFALSTLYKTTIVNAIRFRSTPTDYDNKYPNDTTTPRKYYPVAVARDIPGEENYYWLRVYKNGVFYNQPNQMDFFQDAGYQGTDGDTLLAPVAFFGLTSSTNPLFRYDVCTIEMLSINKDTYSYLTQLNTQLTNAQSGLFAVTPQNVKTNIQQTAGTLKAIGWFNMGAVTSKSQVAE
jgi:hypothetical protein